MEKISDIRLSLDEGLDIEREMLADGFSQTLATRLGVRRASLCRLSVDARRKRDVHFVATAVPDVSAAPVALADRQLPERNLSEGLVGDARPVVVGMGPAGLFAALELAEAGRCPIVIERGAPMTERRADVERFCRDRVLDVESNVQFGEGGAGAFSDGKLTTNTKSPYIARIIETLIAAGAPPDIAWRGKPHVGTDMLGDVTVALRERIIACGGEVRFHTRLVGLDMRDGQVTGVRVESRVGGAAVAGGAAGATGAAGAAGAVGAAETASGAGSVSAEERIPADGVILAVGHSARDVFEMLDAAGFELAPKAFSVGFRIEHLQADIDRAQYGAAAGHPALGAADYKLSCHAGGGRGVYTFCMCPGGEVVAAASEDGGLCVNGMSRHARDGENANAALLCSVVPEDFAAGVRGWGGGSGAAGGSGAVGGALAGVEFQRRIEQAAYRLGGGDWRAPVQRVGDFLAGGSGGGSDSGSSDVQPSYPLGVRECDISECLPDFAVASIREAIFLLDRKLHGFADAGAVLTGVEARSSSPVRVVRDPVTLEASRARGIYPCGEGAGYAGGIVSAAADGIRCARALMES